MKLIIDMDEVLVDFLNPLLEKYLKLKNLTGELTRDDILQYKLSPGMIEIFEKQGFFVELPPMPGAVEGMVKLKDAGHDIIIATSAAGIPHAALEKMLWMKIWLPEFEKDLHIVSRKDRLEGDLICDDCPEYLMHSKCQHKVVMDRRYNRHLVGMHRVSDFNSLLTTIDYLTINPRFRLEA